MVEHVPSMQQVPSPKVAGGGVGERNTPFSACRSVYLPGLRILSSLSEGA